MGGIRLGSVLGFEIRIDYSWFIIFFLILWTLVFGIFPATAPELAPATYLLMGTVATLLFFASLLAHELAHSLVARAKGIPVEGITLFIFGGMAHTRMDFEEPRDELEVAGVGPLSSLAIAALFYLAYWVGMQAGWGSPVTAVAYYLAYINLVLAVFNLFPGFPLDGGRLLRAALWKRTGDPRRATRHATTGGKILGYLLIGFGILNLFAGNLIGGLWLIFIGWFLRTAAEASYEQFVVRRALAGVRAAQVMTPHPYRVPAAISLQQFVDEHVFRGRHQSYPVVDDERPVGIITLERVKQVSREDWGTRTVSDAMVPVDDQTLVRPEERMEDVLESLGRSPVRRVLVMRQGELLGIITQSDVARWLMRADPDDGGGA
jgi:Zn-dependent protease/predicted transcriptional regulator